MVELVVTQWYQHFQSQTFLIWLLAKLPLHSNMADGCHLEFCEEKLILR